MKYMRCNTCRKVVIHNAIGICLACQRGFTREKQEDEVDNVSQKKETMKIPTEKHSGNCQETPTPISKRKRTKEEEND